MTHSVDLNRLVQDIVAKVKAYEEASDADKTKEVEWAQALQCIVFNVAPKRFQEVRSRDH